MQPLIIITGLSGSGKSLAAQCLEDLDFFCVDNLPASLIPPFCELVKRGSEQMSRAALVIDARDEEFTELAPQILEGLKEQSFPFELLFFECSDSTLKRRFKETRRPHPLSEPNETLETAIGAERRAMEPIRYLANRIIDTSHFTSPQLKSHLKETYGGGMDRESLSVNVSSFGFKYGLPPEADLVFDVRFLPNPYFVENLRPMNGTDVEVRSFLEQFEEFQTFKDHLTSMLKFLLPQYKKEGKAYLTLCIGCTGGKHRSVALTEFTGKFLKSLGIAHTVSHRDLGKE